MTARSRLLAMVGLGLLALLTVVAVGADLIAPYDPRARTGVPFGRPSSAHLLGTNDAGQDLLSELIHGAQVSLLVGTVAAAAATVIGALVGVLAGYHRGWTDTVLMRLVDVVLSLPVLPLTIVVGVFAGPGLATQITVIAAVIWAGVARELRAQVLSLRERDHIQALRAMGARAGYVLPRHLLPALVPLMVPQFVLATKQAILLEASLAFLGLGELSRRSWGTTLSVAHARSAFLSDAWVWWVLPPGLAIAITVLAFALLGYAFEERARPVLRDGPVPGPRAAAPSAPVPTAAGDEPLLFDGVTIDYGAGPTAVRAVDEVSVAVAAGELVGLVGESGSGKSTVAATAVGLLARPGRITGGAILVDGVDLAGLDGAGLRAVRGARVGFVPQEAMSALDPVRRVGQQIAESITAHRSVPGDRVRARVDELLELVGLDAGLARGYPHQLSGGMRQRVVIAIALAQGPAVLVADEPTSGLDVITAADLLDLLDGLRHRLGLAVLVVTHDLPVIERVADRIAVLHAGRLVELGDAARVMSAPAHPYTRALVAAVARLEPA